MNICSANIKPFVSRTLWPLAVRPLHSSVALQSMELYPCPERFKKEGEVRPVVVLFGWLLAKSRHLHKYGELYHKYGADIITVKLEVMEILRPRKAELIATKVLKELTSAENKDRPVVVHGFSVGGYLYSHVLKLMENLDMFSPVKQRILGQIFDSPVDFQGVPRGISNAASKNPLIRWLMRSSIELYLRLVHYTSKVYLAQSHLFHNNPVRSPALFLFSKGDKIADFKTCQACADFWKEELNMDVRQICFESSPHVSHFYLHNEEYTQAVTDFLRVVKLPAVSV
ncbi:transmembrane protein 53-like [Montipora foliosa]|uniref:transmembrane protein 53-like n=1 Tax=Montipora foliosa TaxID=591990 RepID=UPI0035F1BF35